MERGQLDQALIILVQLVAADPRNAEAWYKYGNVLKGLNRPIEALDSYGRAIELEPRYTAALSNRGVVLLSLGRIDEALDAFSAAIETSPTDAVVRYNCAAAYSARGEGDAAISSFSKAIELRPAYAEAYFGRGLICEENGQWATALNDFSQALRLGLDSAATNCHRGNALAGLKQWSDALGSYDRALALDSQNAMAHLNRGNVLRQLGQWEAALASFARAGLIQPDLVDSHFNSGVLLEQLGRLHEAIAHFDRALAIRPDFAPAHYNRSLALLMSGELVRGFEGYDWRWKNREQLAPQDHRGPIPLWNGLDSLVDKTILIFGEQGLGDTIQFCRYLGLVEALGARVIFEVQEPLFPLLSHIAGASLVVPRGGTIPGCDYKCALMTLPRAFKTALHTIPRREKYIHADARLIRLWEARLGARTRPRIGLAWSGNPQHPNDQSRSMSLAGIVDALPREFDYFCLQRDIPEADRAYFVNNTHLKHHPIDFMETAALCECLELVISVDTSIAHLAGALGRPLWLLLAFNADWRWLKARDDSPWYPGAVLYRQPSLGDWDLVMTRVAADLRKKFRATVA